MAMNPTIQMKVDNVVVGNLCFSFRDTGSLDPSYSYSGLAQHFKEERFINATGLSETDLSILKAATGVTLTKPKTSIRLSLDSISLMKQYILSRVSTNGLLLTDQPAFRDATNITIYSNDIAGRLYVGTPVLHEIIVYSGIQEAITALGLSGTRITRLIHDLTSNRDEKSRRLISVDEIEKFLFEAIHLITESKPFEDMINRINTDTETYFVLNNGVVYNCKTGVHTSVPKEDVYILKTERGQFEISRELHQAIVSGALAETGLSKDNVVGTVCHRELPSVNRAWLNNIKSVAILSGYNGKAFDFFDKVKAAKKVE